MAKTATKMTLEEMEKVVEKLSPEKQVKLSDRLWAIRMERLAAKMRSAAIKNKLTEKELREVCERAREEVYQKSRRRRQRLLKRST